MGAAVRAFFGLPDLFILVAYGLLPAVSHPLRLAVGPAGNIHAPEVIIE